MRTDDRYSFLFPNRIDFEKFPRKSHACKRLGVKRFYENGAVRLFETRICPGDVSGIFAREPVERELLECMYGSMSCPVRA